MAVQVRRSRRESYDVQLVIFPLPVDTIPLLSRRSATPVATDAQRNNSVSLGKPPLGLSKCILCDETEERTLARKIFLSGGVEEAEGKSCGKYNTKFKLCTWKQLSRYGAASGCWSSFLRLTLKYISNFRRWRKYCWIINKLLRFRSSCSSSLGYFRSFCTLHPSL